MYEVVGIQRLDYTNKSGKHVQGYRVHFTYDFDPRDGESRGKACDSVYLSSDVFAECGVDVGSPAMPVYNKFGRCTGFVDSPLA